MPKFFVDGSSGDVNFGYEATGTTPKLTWDASAESVSLDSAVVINESGADVDFRIESDTDANAFFLEGSSGNVGVGTSSPTAKLSVDGSAVFNESGADVDFRIESDTDANAFFLDGATGDVSIGQNLKFNSGYGSVATAYGCRAWVNFNGTGTVAIRESGNVSSITDNASGDYTVNFTTAMPDANYAAFWNGNGPTLNDYNNNFAAPYISTPTTSAIRIFIKDTGAGGATGRDVIYGYVTIFR